jgi:Family of unknown function (DUF6011)
MTSLIAFAVLILCAKCRRILTDPESIARGLGPDCAAAFHLERERGVEPAENAVAFPFAAPGGLYAAGKRRRGNR